MVFKSLSDKGVYSLSVMNEDEKYFYVEIRALKPGVNRNNWDFTLEGIKENGKTFVGQPLLIAYKHGKDGKIGDGHNFSYSINPKTGEIEADFRDGDAERIVGEVTDYRMEEQDTEMWLVLSARIWKYYSQQLVDYIIDTKAMDVSVEVSVAEDYEVRDDGVEVFTEWTGLGVTILGQGVTPAVEGARLRALAASEEYKQMRVLAASYVPNVSKSNKGGQLIMNEALRKAFSAAMTEYGQVLGFSADGRFASVLRNDGVPTVYPLSDFNESDGVMNSKFMNATIMLSAEITGEDGTVTNILCSAGDITAKANAEAETAKAEFEAYKTASEAEKTANAEALEKANARIAELETAEKERTLAEMTTAFDEAVNAHNLTASANERITEEEINVIHNNIKEGKYADKDTVVGEFKKLAYDKHVATAKKVEKQLAWNFGKDGGTPTGEDAVIASFLQ